MDSKVINYVKKRLDFPGYITGHTQPDVQACLTAVLAAVRITRTVIRGGRLGAGHGRPARMSESHAGTSGTFVPAIFLEQVGKLKNETTTKTHYIIEKKARQ
jgi:hypothetical protein